jgi:hypothetical protein
MLENRMVSVVFLDIEKALTQHGTLAYYINSQKKNK